MGRFGETRLCEAIPALAAADALDAGDVVGGLLTFNTGVYGGGIIRGVQIVDDDNEKAALKLYLFNSAPTAIANDAAFALTAADLKALLTNDGLPYIAFAAADWNTVTSDAVVGRGGLEIDFSAPNGKLYGYLVCDATPTYTAETDLTVRLTLWVN